MTAKRKKHTPDADGAKSSRLNLLIQPELKQWAHAYAKKRGKTVSGIIMEHFVELREQERGADVQQI